MFGMGWQEIMLILVIGVLVIGPDQLPGVARTIGKLVAQFKRATNDLRTAVSEEIEQQEELKEFKEFANDLESEVYGIQDTAKDLVDKEIEKGERELEQLEAEVTDSGDSDGADPEKSSDAIATGDYGPTLDVAAGEAVGGGNSDGEDSAAGDGASGDGDIGGGDIGETAGRDAAVGGSADDGGTSAADTTQKESA